MVTYLKRTRPNLKAIKNLLLKKDMDYFLMVVGYERSGKSNLAQAIAQAYLEESPKYHHKHKNTKIQLTSKNFVFDVETLQERVYTLPRGSPIIIDEGATTILAHESITPQGREALKLVTTMGERNLFVIICVPDFFLVQPYIRNNRVKSVFRVVSRGRYYLYNKVAMGKIIKDKKTGRTRYPPFTYVDYWGEQKGELWGQYEKLKSEYLSRRSIKKDRVIGIKEVSEITGLSTATIYNYCDKGLIPYFEVLGRKKFRESDIANLVINHEAKHKL